MLEIQRFIELLQRLSGCDLHAHSQWVEQDELPLTERGYLRLAKFEAALAQTIHAGIEIGTTKRDVIDTRAGGSALAGTPFNQVHQRMPIRIKPEAAGFERRAPAFSQPQDVAIKLLQPGDVCGWRPNVHVVYCVDGH
jgi:hypothetical protein